MRLELRRRDSSLTRLHFASGHNVLLVADHEDGTEGDARQAELVDQLLQRMETVTIADIVHEDHAIRPVNQVSDL